MPSTWAKGAYQVRREQLSDWEWSNLCSLFALAEESARMVLENRRRKLSAEIMEA